jgi:hypothetical protein
MGVDGNHQLTRMRPNGPGRGRFADYMMRGGTGPLMVAALAHDHEAMQALLKWPSRVCPELHGTIWRKWSPPPAIARERRPDG